MCSAKCLRSLIYNPQMAPFSTCNVPFCSTISICLPLLSCLCGGLGWELDFLVSRIASRLNLSFPHWREMQILGHFLSNPIQHPPLTSDGLGFYSLSISRLQMRAGKNLKTELLHMDVSLYTVPRCPAKEANRAEFQSCRKGCLFFFLHKSGSFPLSHMLVECVHTEGISFQNLRTLQADSSLS